MISRNESKCIVHPLLVAAPLLLTALISFKLAGDHFACSPRGDHLSTQRSVPKRLDILRCNPSNPAFHLKAHTDPYNPLSTSQFGQDHWVLANFDKPGE